MRRLEERSTQLPLLELPLIIDGVDLGSLYELAEALVEQGAAVRARSGARVSA